MRRKNLGMRRCNRPGCTACPYIQPGKTFKAKATNHTVVMEREANCNTCNRVYAISCGAARCGQQYIGQTSKSLKERLRQHLGYIGRNMEATGRHFNLPGHNQSDLKITAIEKIHDREVWGREEVEYMHIRKANIYYKGINLKL